MKKRLATGATGAIVVAIAALIGATPHPTIAAPYDLPLPSHITIETVPLPGDNDPNRCVAWAFAEFPVIPHAKSYELTIVNTRDGTRQTKSGPLFPDDTWSDYPAKFKVHKGFHWFALSGYSTGTGCADAILAFEGAYKIVRSRVTLSQKVVQEMKEPMCETVYTRAELERAKPRGVQLDLPIPNIHPRGRPVVLTTRNGEVHTVDPGTNQPVKVGNNRIFDEGRIITDPRNGVVQITDADGHNVLVTPGTTVEIKGGEMRIVQYKPAVSIKKLTEMIKERRSGCPYRVRTDSAVLSARG